MSFPSQINIFSSDKWRYAKPAQRIAALQALENYEADLAGRSARTVRVADMASVGSYDPHLPDQILIDRQLVEGGAFYEPGDGYRAADVVIHEGRHAYQDDVTTGKVAHHDQHEVQQWARNQLRGVYQPTTGTNGQDIDLYYFQPIERDAQNYAFNHMQELHHQLGEDHDFDDYSNQQSFERQVAVHKAHEEGRGDDIIGSIDREINERYEQQYGPTLPHEALQPPQFESEEGMDRGLGAALGGQFVPSISQILLTALQKPLSYRQDEGRSPGRDWRSWIEQQPNFVNSDHVPLGSAIENIKAEAAAEASQQATPGQEPGRSQSSREQERD